MNIKLNKDQRLNKCSGAVTNTNTGFELIYAANPIVPGQNVDPSMAAGLGQKALLAKRFAKAR